MHYSFDKFSNEEINRPCELDFLKVDLKKEIERMRLLGELAPAEDPQKLDEEFDWEVTTRCSPFFGTTHSILIVEFVTLPDPLLSRWPQKTRLWGSSRRKWKKKRDKKKRWMAKNSRK